MGVTGLWDILQKAGRSQSLLSLTVTEGFEKNPSGRRALRVGIDVSLWYQHALGGKGGENPELRALFFRVLNLLETPMIPLFVFDGRERPKLKRGSKMGKAGSHKFTAKMKEMLDIFGVEWRMARGEAEAELAFLNQAGIIDAVMTDDADALLFGAKMIIRNPNSKSHDEDGKSNKTHVRVFVAEELKNHGEVGLTKGGMILFALLCGGDYDKGVRGIGAKVAHGLARCGFGERLITAYDELDRQGIDAFLPQWRAEVNSQLHTNSKGFLPHRCPSVILPNDFPNIEVLVNYAHPICSATVGTRGGPLTDKGSLSIASLARFSEYQFGDWGFRSKIVDRFRDLVWHAALMSVLRRAALEADEKEKNRRSAAGRRDLTIHGPLEPSAADGVGTSATLVKKYLDPVQEDIVASAFVNKGPQAPTNNANVKILDEHPLIAKIIGFRAHKGTDRLPEYRIEVNPTQFVDLAHAGIQDIRDDPGETRDLKKPRPEPHEILKLWVPASMMKQVHPQLVEEYQTGQMEKAAGGTAKKPRGTAATHQSDDDDDEPASPTKSKGRPRASNTPLTATQAGSSTPLSSQAGSRQAGSSCPAPLIEIPDNSSLPMRPCRFSFTFPNPDDFLLSDEGDEIAADANTTVEVRRVEATAVVSTARPASVQTQRQPRQSEPSNIGLETGGDDGGGDVDEHEPRTYTDAWLDNVLFGKKRKTKTAAKSRKRGRKSQVDDMDKEEHQEHQTAAKRQKISQPSAIVQSSSSVAVARGNNRPTASFPIDAPTSVRGVRHSDANSSLAQVRPQASVMDADSQDEVVVAGTGARKGKTVSRNGRPGRREYVPPLASSQDSKLGDDFLCDADLVIDLT